MTRHHPARDRLLALSLALPLLLAASSAGATCSVDPCANGGSSLYDCDLDGYTDAEECNGLRVTSGAALDFPSCRSAPQPECLDARVADIFVLFQKASPSIYDALGITPKAAFAPITQTSGAGLAMRVHVLDAATTTLLPLQNRKAVTPRQAALLIREVLTPPSACPVTAALGTTAGGGVAPSLNNSKEGIVYTQRIVDHVDCVYNSVNPSIPQSTRLPEKVKMVQHTTSHELTHNSRVAPDFVDRFGGHHYRTGSGCVMDQSTTYTTKNGAVSFATSLAYCGPDQSAAIAGETSLGRIHCEDPDDVIDADAFTIKCLPPAP